MSNYVHPEYLVETDWVAAHLNDPNVRLIESDEDPLLYPMGHIPGAVQVDWFTTLQHPLRRDRPHVDHRPGRGLGVPDDVGCHAHPDDAHPRQPRYGGPGELGDPPDRGSRRGRLHDALILR